MCDVVALGAPCLVVLVDDVVTSGGHLVAAKTKLERAGATVLFAVTVGYTVEHRVEKPFALREDTYRR